MLTLLVYAFEKFRVNDCRIRGSVQCLTVCRRSLNFCLGWFWVLTNFMLSHARYTHDRYLGCNVRFRRFAQWDMSPFTPFYNKKNEAEQKKERKQKARTFFFAGFVYIRHNYLRLLIFPILLNFIWYPCFTDNCNDIYIYKFKGSVCSENARCEADPCDPFAKRFIEINSVVDRVSQVTPTQAKDQKGL